MPKTKSNGAERFQELEGQSGVFHRPGNTRTRWSANVLDRQRARRREAGKATPEEIETAKPRGRK